MKSTARKEKEQPETHIRAVQAAAEMKALVYYGPGKRSFEKKPKPVLQSASDVIVRIERTTICGTDLHILKGDVPTVEEGRILGHEGVGVVDQVGEAVTNFKPGDRVLISCITACGRCGYCKKAMYSHCENGGWILGHKIDGTQAEFVRIPYGDTSLYRIPEGLSDDAMILLSDILPTGFECGVLNGKIQPGDSVAIIGAGPIGLASLITSLLYSPSEIIMIDTDANRLDVAKKFGATHGIQSKEESDTLEQIMKLTNGKGVNVAIEAVGIPATFELCQRVIAPGGHIANVGVHGKSAALHLEDLWSKNITITTRLVDTETTPLLLKMLESGKLRPEALVTHHFKMDEMMKAYDTFGNAAKENVLKVAIENPAA